jgi:putative peptidoglycan lipid II flippase
MIPSSIGLALIARPVIHLIYEHGKFTAADTADTRSMLIMFCIGLFAAAGLRLVMQAYYAVEDMVTPLWSAAMAMIVNIIGCWWLSRYMGRAGVPLAISLAAIINLAVLWARLPGIIGSFDVRPLGRTILVSIVASLPMAAIILPANTLDIWFHPGKIVLKALLLSGEVGAGIALFALVAWLFKAPELTAISDSFMRRLKKKK